MTRQPDRLYEFGPFRVDGVKRLLLKDGAAMPVTSKVLDLLLVLIENGGQVLRKDELMTALWPDTSVEENNLTQHVSMLRKALDDRAGEHRYVVTVPGRGYSFVAPVTALVNTVPDGPAGPAREDRTGPRDRPGADAGGRAGAAPASGGFNLNIFRRPRPAPAALALSLLAVALAVAAHYFSAADRAGPKEVTESSSVAILPFKSLNAEERDGYMGAGMADTLIAKLSNIRQINVRSTSAVIRYADKDQDAVDSGRELGVDSVLEGTIQRAGDRVRVTVQLVRVRDRKPLWAQSFEERFTDIFALQDSISEQVAQAMLPSLSVTEFGRLRKHHTESVEAYEAYLKGRYLWNKRNGEGLGKSVEAFEQAIALDPGYALAYAGLADAYSVLGAYKFGSLAPDECRAKAKAAAVRALEIDGTLAEAHTSLAWLTYHLDRDAEAAETGFKRAIELNPNYATAHHWYSDFLAMLGRVDESMAEIERARQLDPISPIINTTLGERFYFSRRYDEAIARLRDVLEIDPDFIQARYLLGLAYEQKQWYGAAIDELQKARKLSGNRPFIAAALGHTYAASGRKGEARKLLGELVAGKLAEAYDIALIFASLGEDARALEWMRKAYDEHKGLSNDFALFNLDPRLDSLRRDPRFQDFMNS